MTAMTVKDLAMEMIDLREEFLHANVVKERTAE
jgi:PTS system cellobiose-specific IIA component